MSKDSLRALAEENTRALGHNSARPLAGVSEANGEEFLHERFRQGPVDRVKASPGLDRLKAVLIRTAQPLGTARSKPLSICETLST